MNHDSARVEMGTGIVLNLHREINSLGEPPCTVLRRGGVNSDGVECGRREWNAQSAVDELVLSTSGKAMYSALCFFGWKLCRLIIDPG